MQTGKEVHMGHELLENALHIERRIRSTGLRLAALIALKLFVAGDRGGHIHFLHLDEPKPKS